MGKIRETVLDLLFPPRCAFCRALLKKGETGMCAACEKNLPYTSGGGRQKGDFVEACVAPLYYEGTVREALLRYKFDGATAYASLFGRLLADSILAIHNESSVSRLFC